MNPLSTLAVCRLLRRFDEQMRTAVPFRMMIVVMFVGTTSSGSRAIEMNIVLAGDSAKDQNNFGWLRKFRGFPHRANCVGKAFRTIAVVAPFTVTGEIAFCLRML